MLAIVAALVGLNVAGLRDALALQSEVAQAIRGEIKIAVTPEDPSRLARAR